MNWQAANEQQQEARWRIFLMFVAMALLIIRTGLVSRGVIAAISVQSAPQDHAPADHQLSSTRAVDVSQATLVLLVIAEAAGQLYVLNARAVWELMNRPLPRPTQEARSNNTSLCESPRQRLDTS